MEREELLKKVPEAYCKSIFENTRYSIRDSISDLYQVCSLGKYKEIVDKYFDRLLECGKRENMAGITLEEYFLSNCFIRVKLESATQEMKQSKYYDERVNFYILKKANELHDFATKNYLYFTREELVHYANSLEKYIKEKPI